MTAELTEELIEVARADLKTGYQSSTWLVDALCDAALLHVRGREPVAWRQMIHVWSYFDGPLDPREVHDSGKPCEPLFNTPQRTYKDGLLAAAKVCKKQEWHGPMGASVDSDIRREANNSACKKCAADIRAQANKEPT